MTRPLRRDARRNRELLAHTARGIFASKGVDTPLDEIARRAGVSIGTLYNRFPTRSALVEAAFLGLVEHVRTVAEQALEHADPWEGFVHYVTHTGELLSDDRGYVDVCTRHFPGAPELESAKGQVAQLVSEIVTRAQRAGTLRADFVPEDLALLTRSAASTPQAWRRHLGFLLDGLRAEAAHPPPRA